MLPLSTLIQMAKWFAPGLKLDQSGPFLELAARYGQPAENSMPVELLSLGLKMFSRGLYTSLVTQTRTDWKWPYWHTRQSDPDDPAFQPVAHLIITQNRVFRNWVLTGLPDHPNRVAVDPAMMITAQKDGCSFEFWIQDSQNPDSLFSGRETDGLSIPNRFPLIRKQKEWKPGIFIRQNVFVSTISGIDFGFARLKLKNTGSQPVQFKIWISIRPYNPEGIAPVHQIRYDPAAQTWFSGEDPVLKSRQRPDLTLTGNGETGDVWNAGKTRKVQTSETCPAGLVTAASVFSVTLAPGTTENLDFTFPVNREEGLKLIDWADPDLFSYSRAKNRFYYRWNKKWDGKLSISLPDQNLTHLTQFCITGQSLFCQGTSLTPGFLIYDDFWFRDAAFLGHVLLKSGQTETVKLILREFPKRQTSDGYFKSQEGEWDSNGQVLWLAELYWLYTRDENLIHELFPSLVQAGRWIQKKRSGNQNPEVKGLLPAGFSAEHFGANDYYFWDNFWALAGLESLTRLASVLNYRNTQGWAEPEALKYRQRLAEVVLKSAKKHNGILPASPLRALDAGAVGNPVTVYPLQLSGFTESGFQTADHLLKTYSTGGLFYHPVAHTGINIYLTLHLLHCRVYKRDPSVWRDLELIAGKSVPPGTWPEALHPGSGGGVMGEGHHGWANAEWVSAVRDTLVCEWENDLWLTPCFDPEWMKKPGDLSVQQTLTRYGSISFTLSWTASDWFLEWKTDFHSRPEHLIWWIPDTGGEEHLVPAAGRIRRPVQTR